MTPKISIVIPIYNGERYIRRAIEGVLEQTFEDWELLLIDDGSLDSTAAICDEYACERIRVIHQQNCGVSAARNVGIELALGEYIAFVDADDIIEHDYLSNLAQGFGCDLILTGFCYDYSPHTPLINGGGIITTEISTQLAYFLDTHYFCFPWAKLFHRSIIDKYRLRFDTRLRFGEDHVFNWQYLKYVRSLFIDTHPCYRKISDEVHPYNLSFEEMDYLDGRLYELKMELEKTFHVVLPSRSNWFFHVLFLKTPVKNFTVSALLRYYKKYHPTDRSAFGYDRIAKTVYYDGLTQIAKQARKDSRQARTLLREMRHFLDEPWSLYRSTKVKTRLLIPLIYARAYGATLFILKRIIK